MPRAGRTEGNLEIAQLQEGGPRAPSPLAVTVAPLVEAALLWGPEGQPAPKEDLSVTCPGNRGQCGSEDAGHRAAPERPFNPGGGRGPAVMTRPAGAVSRGGLTSELPLTC